MKVLKLTLSGILFILLTLAIGTKSTYAFSIDKLVTDAKKQIGVPYKWGGTSPSGFDCSGFITYIYKQQNVSLPRTSADMFAGGDSVSKSNLQPGDLVFLTTYKSGASHAGVYVGHQQFIHSASNGVTKSGLSDYYWKDRYVGAKRYVATASTSSIDPTKVYWDGLLMVKGQIGKVKVLKSTDVYKRTAAGTLIKERTLQPGQQFRVYQYRSEQGGIYGLGGSLFLKKNTSLIDYRTPSKSKLAILNGLQ